METHDVIHTAYFHSETIEDMDDAQVECVLTCACGEHSYGLGDTTREAKLTATRMHNEHRSGWLAWAQKNPDLAALPALAPCPRPRTGTWRGPAREV